MMKPSSLFASFASLLLFFAILFSVGDVQARVSGPCSDCHTMHNSQDGSPISSSGPKEFLLKTDCLGCHAQGGTQAIVNWSGSLIPQVYHQDATDLAGGNFAYITGVKGGSASEAKGHNIAALTGTDSTLYAPPGGINQFGHNNGTTVNTDNLTCAGANGCHGFRNPYGPSGVESMKGAHHNNVDSQCDQATIVANSYRFLYSVKGFEDSDWEYTVSSSDHNEYYGLATPIRLGCGGGSAYSCHDPGSSSVYTPRNTISEFCATCHGNFHTLETSTSDGVGSTASSPFIRHPTDLSLPSSGEYADYNDGSGYSVMAPVARLSVPSNSNSAVTPGSDAVMCLSCHRAHGSPYADMLRWDYLADCRAGSPNNACGCFVCHTTKD